MTASDPQYTKKDFMSDQIIRWCPGCGDYSILSQVQTVFSQLGLPKEQFAVISGIGCSSRFPYYMNTYGFHTIHGRAPAFATGLKTTRPDLSVWVITGDGDSLSIGGNHIAHVLRRNVDLNILLFNNRIYGLTKGQYSPTSEVGKKTKSTPYGSIDQPFNPVAFALGSGATCIMRSVDVFAKHLRSTLMAANEHTGTSFVEIYQNCNIFNDKAFASFTERAVRDDRVLYLEHGEPMVWGKTSRWGLRLVGTSLEVVEIGEDGSTDGIVVHDETNLVQATQLAHLDPELGHPVPVGTLYKVDRPTYDQSFQDQVEETRTRLGAGDLHDLLHSGDTWTV
jgi:2-oxoglutarate ferredoxin oxidoreductase subunit beta